MLRAIARKWNHNLFRGRLQLTIPKPRHGYGYIDGYTDQELITYLGKDNFETYLRESAGNTCMIRRDVNGNIQNISYSRDVQGFYKDDNICNC